MSSRKISFRADSDTQSIINKFMHDHGCKEAEALRRIIKDYPRLKAKAESKAFGEHLAKTIKETEKKRPVFPSLCKHIVQLDLINNKVECALFNTKVHADFCRKCERREPIDAST